MLILALSGSLRTGSFNTALLRAAGGLLPPAARLELIDGLAAVPPYNEDEDLDPAPAPVALLRAQLAAADALVIATPEYNGSIPGQLKNALDWASRPYPSNALRGTPVAVIGSSTGLFGAVWAQAELRKVLATAGGAVLDHELTVPDAPGAFDAHVRLTDPGITQALREVMYALVSAVDRRRPSDSTCQAPLRLPDPDDVSRAHRQPATRKRDDIVLAVCCDRDDRVA